MTYVLVVLHFGCIGNTPIAHTLVEFKSHTLVEVDESTMIYTVCLEVHVQYMYGPHLCINMFIDSDAVGMRFYIKHGIFMV